MKLIKTIGFIVIFGAVLLLLRFVLAVAVMPLVVHLMSIKTQNFLFWGLQTLIVLGLAIYFLIKRRYDLLIALILGSVLSYSIGPMN